MSDTPRTDAVKDYAQRCEREHGDKIVTHAMCFARALEEADELRELCEKLERKLAAALEQRDEMELALRDLTDAFADYGGPKHSGVYKSAIKALGWDAPMIKECGK